MLPLASIGCAEDQEKPARPGRAGPAADDIDLFSTDPYYTHYKNFMARTSSAKVLVVDDEQVHRYMLCSMLEEWGWQCEEADDGVTAVEAVQQGPFDAILMDIRMTTMDGMEALKRIHAVNPAIPVVIMTAYSSVDSAIEAIKQGAHDYLTKPLDFDRLRETLEIAMGHRHQDEAPGLQGEPFGEDGQIIGSSPAMQVLW